MRSQTSAERQKDQRRRLLRAAAEIFAAQGFARANVEAIVDKAGMSRRTFYEHFTSLEDILLQLHDRAASAAFRYVEAVVRSLDGDDPLARLRAAVAAFLGVVAEHPDLSRVVFREVRAAGPDLEVRRDVVLGRYVTLLFEQLATAHARGLVGRPPDELTLYTLVAGAESVAMRYVSRGETARAQEAVPTLVELLLRAFR
ncbi:MAG: helix-turn-helix domain-containing protein [Minicystis sp.]